MGKLFEEPPWYETLGINIIKCGRIPKHIAFIMDGNRRYVKERKIEGKNPGADKASEVLKWCLLLEVKEVTIFAFSIHNYKRDQKAVKELMDNFLDYLIKIEEHIDEYHENGICFRAVGNLKLLPIKIQERVEQLVAETKNNSEFTLNIALSYTFGDELTTSVKTIVDGVKSSSIRVEDIDDQLVYDCLYTNFVSKPDILVRTSGETRFSDFLLWQIEDARCYFIKPLWPEITLWHMLSIILNYQIHFETNHYLKQLKLREDEEESRVRSFVAEVRKNSFIK